MLTKEQQERFARQLVLEGVGPAGQERLASARVLVVGVGGLGSPVCLYLAAAGVGTLGIVDFDSINLSNLNRQILYRVSDLGRPKAAAAAETMRALNPGLTVIEIREKLTPERAVELVAGYDLVVECSDTFDTKFLVNAACVRVGVPLVWASVLAWEGQMSVVLPDRGPCYQCLFPPQPELADVPTSYEVGILGAAAGTMGALEAVEALKVLLDFGDPLVGRLLVWDGAAATIEIVSFFPQPGCPVCGKRFCN